jgi:hypothetical protein
VQWALGPGALVSFTVGFYSSIWTRARDNKSHLMGASMYYRGGLVAPAFKAAGMGGWCSASHKMNRDGSVAINTMDHEYQTPDVLWTQLLFGPDYIEMTRRARAAGQVVVADVDDDYWAVPKSNAAAHKWATAAQRDQYFDQLAACDAIIVSSDTLGYKASRLGPPVYELRNMVDCQWIQPHDPWGTEDTPLPVAWVGSTPWRAAADLRLLAAAGLSGWLRDHGEKALHCGHIGLTAYEKEWARSVGGQFADLPPTFAGHARLGFDQVETRPHVPFINYPALWDRVGVSLVPLENHSFNRSKSWLKGLESCAAGVPFICSWLPDPSIHRGFPEYEALIAEGARGRTFRNDRPTELLDHLDDLNDPVVRRREGAINREVALRNDVRVRWVEWANVLAEVVGRRLPALSTPLPSNLSETCR